MKKTIIKILLIITLLLGFGSSLAFADNKDTDGDGIIDSQDKEINTNPNNIRYVCTKRNMKFGEFHCGNGPLQIELGVYSTFKKKYHRKSKAGKTITSNYNERVNSDNKNQNNNAQNDFLDNSQTDNHYGKGTKGGVEGISAMTMSIAQSLKNIFIAIASIYLLIIVLKLLFSEGSSDEEFNKFKKGAQWTTAGIIVMQISYSYVSIIYNKKDLTKISESLTENIIQPLIKLLETGASLFFIAIMLFAFYKIITSAGDEEKAKSGKKSIIFALVGFMVIKVSKFFVEAIYSQTLCSVDGIGNCNKKSLSDGVQMSFDIINWLNGFVGVVIVMMIIYAGAQIIFSNGEDDKIKKAKKSIIYIIIGITLLIINYLILTFFLVDNLTK